ncbi:hypothetical protein Tco_1379919 [Tanacetum coccineum]
MLLSHHAQPFIPSSFHTPTRLVPIHVNPYSQLSAGLVNGQTPNFPFQTQIGNPLVGGSFVDSTGSVTPFVCWIEDYPLLDGLKMPSHIGSYDGKGDPDNFLHLFEGAIRMQKWLILVACHIDEVFSIWKTFGRNTRDLGSFGEEMDKTTDLHQHLSRISTQQLETASQITRDVVTTHTKTASQDLKMASECMTQPII